MPSYLVPVTIKATAVYEVEADNMEEAKTEADSSAFNGDLPRDLENVEVIKVGKPTRED